MPTLPLYTPADVPDGSHRVIAPGGYETWNLNAESAAGDVRLVAVLGVGSPLDATYLWRYLRYRRRPTRVAPPVPAESPFAHVAVYEGGRLLARFTTHAKPEEFAPSEREPAVKVAGNELVREGDGSLSVRLRGLPAGRGARGTPGGACLSAQLTCRPLHPHRPFETTLLGERVSADLHRWVVAAPSCEVLGSVVFTPEAADNSRVGVREINFRGRGYYDHRYGTGLLGTSLRGWASGQVSLGDTTYAFHAGRPLDRAMADDVRLVRCDAEGVREVNQGPWRVAWNNRGPLELPYPAEVVFGDRLRLTAPRVLDAERCYLRLLYHASAHGGTESGTAWCEVGVPPNRASLFRRWATTAV